MLHTLTNITGLTLGIAACIIVWFYIRYETNYDNFHSDADNIYRVTHEYIQNGKTGLNSARTFPSLGYRMKNELPGIDDFTRLYPFSDVYIKQNDKTFFEKTIYAADSNFFDFFKFEFISGDPNTVLYNPNHIILSESTAKKIFGNENPLDKTLTVFGNQPLLVKGIFKDYPENSHFKFNIIFSQLNLLQFNPGFGNNDWFVVCYTYIKLNPNSSVQNLYDKFPKFCEGYRTEHKYHEFNELKLKLQPIKDIHLTSNLQHEMQFNSSYYYLYFLIMLAILLFCIASINFINIQTTSSIKRVKEVGVQKALGNNRFQQVVQFLAEAFIINCLSFFIAVIIVILASKDLNLFFEKQAITLFNIDIKTIAVLTGIVFASTIITGIYPAIFLSSKTPDMALRELTNSSDKGINIRKLLLVLQYAACIGLIGGSAVIFRQSKFLRNQDTGFDKEQMLIVKTPRVNGDFTPFLSTVSTFKEELLANTNILNITTSSTIPGKETRGFCYNCMQSPKCPEDYTETFYIYNADVNFFDTYNIELLAGRNFSTNYDDENEYIIIDETSYKSLHYDTPEEAINDVVKWIRDERTIIGVVKNFHHESFKANLKPTIFYSSPFGAFFTVKLNSSDIKNTISYIEEKWEKYFSEDPISYFFLNTYYDQQYKEEDRVGNLIFALAGLSFFIACLGLFSLISFSIIQNAKSISIHKVSGAKFNNILILVAKEYIFALAIASIVALPVGYFFLQRWLSNYAYQIEIGWWYYIIPLTMVTFVSYITINFEVRKVNRKNPAEALNSE